MYLKPGKRANKQSPGDRYCPKNGLPCNELEMNYFAGKTNESSKNKNDSSIKSRPLSIIKQTGLTDVNSETASSNCTPAKK